MITWRTTATGYSATLTIAAVCFARLHASATGWEIEHLDGTRRGPAASLGEAKRGVLQALSELLGKAGFEVDVALRSS